MNFLIFPKRHSFKEYMKAIIWTKKSQRVLQDEAYIVPSLLLFRGKITRDRISSFDLLRPFSPCFLSFKHACKFFHETHETKIIFDRVKFHYLFRTIFSLGWRNTWKYLPVVAPYRIFKFQNWQFLFSENTKINVSVGKLKSVTYWKCWDKVQEICWNL